jgi:predicted metalloprotease with PDZ domain
VAAWQLDWPAGGPGELTLRYRILATELSVRTCHLNADHGFLTLAAVVLQVEGERWSPHSLELLLPEGWQPFLPLPRGDDGRWRAANYDQLIDTPIEAGSHPVHTFLVMGVPHRWVSWGDDLPRLDGCWLEDVTRVCEQCCRLMGEEAPASTAYLFVLHLLERGYGGLEHDDASVLVFSRRQLEEPRGRRKLLQLVAHEYLHQWNVRRLRPAELHPYDYDAPSIIPTLWFAEGVTSYVDQLLPVAAGISGEEDLLEDLGADLSRFLLTPGRAVQSLRLSSQEAWVKLYRQDAHSSDNQISYYLKGAVIALVLDLHLRRHGSWLGAVLQQLWRSHGRCERGYREADLLAAFQAHASDLATLLPAWLDGLEDPPLEAALAEVGLLLRPEPAEIWNPGWDADLQDGILLLRRVVRHGAAERAGLQVGDELLALAGRRVRSSACLAAALRAGTGTPPNLSLWISRDGRVRELLLTPDPPAVQRWHLERDPRCSAEAQNRRQRWCRLLP